MHEFGNYLGTITFYAEPYEVDEEYEEYLSTLNREELEEESMRLKAQLEVLDDLWGV